ncbi:MAG TPA: fatty acid desaturase [Gemmataceae bacterium]|jgi:hypothetical protein|nr:fatty acid desaturase [Gemmataceae bacterium]
MSLATLTRERRGVLRHSPWDALLVALAAAQGVLLALVPAAPVVALGLWWNSNTVAHHFIHRPFFRARLLNRLFALYLSVLLGVPQSVWRGRHLAHHAAVPWRLRLTAAVMVEASAVLALWAVLVALCPRFFLTAYLPGYLAGLALCSLHGYYEHARGTTSHYGAVYNHLFFNDGYHAEHHADPGTHWTRLPARVQAGVRTSRWPAVLRWLDGLTLEGLERWVLRSGPLQRFVLAAHERAFRRLLPRLPAVRRVGVVGGGLFPRTVLILRRLLPHADLVVIDASAVNIDSARAFIPGAVEVINAWYDPSRHDGFDLLVVPLAFVGDRRLFYDRPPAPAVLIHDWLWRRRGPGTVVSLLLLKRLNLVLR